MRNIPISEKGTYGDMLAAAVRDAVVDAVEDLYLRERSPQDAAQALIDLSHGSNLGARTAVSLPPAYTTLNPKL